MNVLHIALSDSGGAGIGMMGMHRALLRMGVDSRVLVAIKHSGDRTVTVMRPNQNVWGSNRYVLLLEKAARRLGITFNAYDRTIRRVYQARRECNVPFSPPVTQYDVSRHPLVDWADVINLHFVSGFVDIPSFFVNVRKPIVWTMRDENPGLGGFHYSLTKQQCYPHFAELEDEFLSMKRKAILQCQNMSIVSLSETMRRFCESVDFLACRPNTTIYNAISPDDYTMHSRADARRMLGLRNDDIILSFVCCHLSERRKRFAETVAAINRLGDSRIKLLCVGKCDVKPTTSNAVILGTVNDKSQMSLIYSASDAFVSPSAQESFGKTVVEAMYCGTPVVSTPVGIATEIIDESNGALCASGTPEDIASAVGKVLARNYNRQAIRQNAVRLFAPEKIAKKYIDIYNTCRLH